MARLSLNHLSLPILAALALGAGGCGDDDHSPSTAEPATCQAVLEMCSCSSYSKPATCIETQPQPDDIQAIAEFVRDNAQPLQCLDDSDVKQDNRAIIDSVADAAVVFFGETHGAAENGPASSSLFNAMVEQASTTYLVLEFGIDLTEPLNTYLNTGGGELATLYGYSSWAAYFPAQYQLVEAARAQVLGGRSVVAFGADIPWRLGFANERLLAIASTMNASTGLVLDNLPPAQELWADIDQSYVDATRAYFLEITANLATICLELTAAQCEELEQMARALWLGASIYGDWQDLDAYYLEREELIYFSFRQIPSSPTAKAYAHMGSSHSIKSPVPYAPYEFVAMRLNSDHEPTMNRVYSIAQAYGGGRISYNGTLIDLDPYPALLTNALAGAALDRYLVATVRPGAGCVANPLATVEDELNQAPMGSIFDAFLYFERLTPISQ